MVYDLAMRYLMLLMLVVCSVPGAHASDPRPPRPADNPYMVRARYERFRQGVLAVAPDLSGDTPTVRRSGREDIVAFSSTSAESVLATLKGAYSSRAVIGGVFTVEGFAHLAASDSHTFTLEEVPAGSTSPPTRSHTTRAVIEVMHDPQGVRIVFWGLTSGGPPPPRRPITDLPVRLR